VSVVALNGMTFDLATPHGRMMATVLAGIAEFERELIQARIRSGIAAAKARGSGWVANLGSGQNPTEPVCRRDDAKRCRAGVTLLRSNVGNP
jgi:putative DNA-invertase from lambdoid prophage Rac